MQHERILNIALEKIEEELQRRGSTLKNYPEMPFPDLTNKEDAGNVFIEDELNYNTTELK